jgi:hypothetical protein
MNLLTTSYIAASAAMIIAAIYLLTRLRLFLTASTILIVSLLLIFGPSFIGYTLSEGEPHFLVRLLFGLPPTPPNSNTIFAIIGRTVPDVAGIVTAMNFSMAIMYVGIVAGMELASRLLPERLTATRVAIETWRTQKLHDEATSHALLLIAIVILSLLMLFVSIRENQIGTIFQFFSIHDNLDRNLLRAHSGGSSNYLYRVALSAIAPMFVVWGFLSGAVNRSWPLIAASALLLLATIVGKVDTLSKAPMVFFLFQLLFATLLVFTNRISWKLALFGGIALALIIFVIVKMVIIFAAGESAPLAVYSRVFEAESQSLFENFAVFPAVHPFMWGANLRPIAWLLGLPYTPSFSMVAYTWYQDPNLTSPSLFIADAWADFAYAGVLVYSVIAGALCRCIDMVFLTRGKTAPAIAVLCASLWGILVLLTTALNTALLTGGLLLTPILAAMIAPGIRRSAVAA